MKNFFILLCGVCIAYGILSFLPSKKETGKITNFVLALCFLISVVSGIVSFRGDDYSFNFKNTQIDYSAVSSKAFSVSLEQMLKNNNIKFKKVTVDSSINKSGGISINEIAVFGVENIQECKALITENTGLTKEVKVYE